MYTPSQNIIPTSRDIVSAFRGYNHTYQCQSGEWYDTKNLTTAHYPVMATRQPRKRIAKLGKPLGITTKDAPIYVDGSKLYINGNEVTGITLDSTTEKQLVGMGAYLVIFPDKYYVNTVDTTDKGYMEQINTINLSDSRKVTYSLCTVDGADISAVAAPQKPSSPANGDYWIDTSGETHVLMQYAATTDQWITVPTVYVKIAAQGIGVGFNQYDGVSLSGFTCDEEDEKLKEQINALNATSILYAVGEDYVVVVGLLSKTAEQTSGTVTAARKVPDMNYVIEHDNRLWGCKYGYSAAEQKVVNELYACKLGDFKNWDCFMGISTDSYRVSLGSDGQFTGAATYLGHPTFFKENVVHKIYGNYPANYSLVTTDCPGKGVQNGSFRSLDIVNGVLFYKAPTGVCAYTGDYPQSASASLGDAMYYGAVACGVGDRYYIAMKDAENMPHVFVYDTSYGTWMHEDNADVAFMASVGNTLYMIYANGEMRTASGGTEADEHISWMAQTGNMGFNTPDNKYVSNVDIRMNLENGSHVDIWINYDSSDYWEHVGGMDNVGTKAFNLPIIPRRCDHFALKLSGTGACKVFSISKVLEIGSDAQ
jgi:hypothetical protein